jgi:hypothetical protein
MSDPARNPSFIATLAGLSNSFFLGFSLIYIGLVVGYLSYSDSWPGVGVALSILFERHGGLAVGGLLAMAGLCILIYKNSLAKEERFVDVDNRQRGEASTAALREVLEKISRLESRPNNDSPITINATTISSLKAATKELESAGLAADEATFRSYFSSIRQLLEQKAAAADEKASILLDKGTSYSRGGIVFFVVAIIAWQVLSYFTEFRVQYIYGIVSCSLLFVFIEFLSAWFLKQYRHFVDTSTYLIKVKSIFDKYMLVYLASREAISDGHDTKKSTGHLLDLLKTDISWPDSYLHKTPDVSFAREAIETMSVLAKSMRNEKAAVSEPSAGRRQRRARTNEA